MGFAAKRIQQISIGILAALSLFVSSISACACSHHEQGPEPETKSCHGTAVTPDKDSVVQHAGGSSVEENCFCIQQAAKLSVKAETFKFKKQVSAFAWALGEPYARFHSPIPGLGYDRAPRIRLSRILSSASSRGPPSS